MAAVTSDRALNGWHPGEVIVQGIMNLPARVTSDAVVNHLPEQHRAFHTSRLHLLPVTTLDEHGRPWVSILTSKNGKPEFISSSDPTKLRIQAYVWDSDPIIHNVEGGRNGSPIKPALLSGIGLEPSTRRRNKFAGHIIDSARAGNILTLNLTVKQALGLCPKYINIRGLEPYIQADPCTIYERREMLPEERLPQNVLDYINNADTAYLGTSYVACPEDEEMFPSHVGTNHRGGRPGFVRVRADGRSLVLPNYNGNRLMNSMGNIQVTPFASLAFPSFYKGSVLYVTGEAQNLFGKPAREIMPESNVITTIKTTGFVFVQNALPLREASQDVNHSPYCPPIRYLAEETLPENRYDDVTLALLSAVVHNDTLATFTFKSSRPIEIGPSQNVVLELKELLRVHSHKYIEWVEGKNTENDDCVRTWTVSVLPTPQEPRDFSITVRQIHGGLITPIMYQIVNKVSEDRGYNQVIPMAPLDITARLRGIGGDLPVPNPVPMCDGGRKLLWVAGGIGITPFLSLTQYASDLASKEVGLWDIVVVLSTREPDAILLLLNQAFGSLKGKTQIKDFSYMLHLFTTSPEDAVLPLGWPTVAKVHAQEGRLETDGAFFSSIGAKNREPHICGPLPFIKTAMKAMENAGVDPERVKRERFTY